MQKLNFDLGLKEYEIGGGVLRFNPGDPNVYARFAESVEKFSEVEQRLVAKEKEAGPEASGETILKMMAEADCEMKAILTRIFGVHNDFDAIFCGVNVMSIGDNGERVITNFIHTIAPAMAEDAKKCAKQQIHGAVANASLNRAQRGAMTKQ